MSCIPNVCFPVWKHQFSIKHFSSTLSMPSQWQREYLPLATLQRTEKLLHSSVRSLLWVTCRRCFSNPSSLTNFLFPCLRTTLQQFQYLSFNSDYISCRKDVSLLEFYEITFSHFGKISTLLTVKYYCDCSKALRPKERSVGIYSALLVILQVLCIVLLPN